MSFGSDAIGRVRGICGSQQRNLPPLIPNSQSYHQPSDDNFIRNSPLNPQRKHPKWRTSSPSTPNVYSSPPAEPKGGPRNGQMARSDSIRQLNCVVKLPAQYLGLTPFLTQRFRQRPEQGARAPAHLPGCLPSTHPHLANRETPQWTRLDRLEARWKDGCQDGTTLTRALAEMIFSQNPRSTVLYVPFVAIMWGTTGGRSKSIPRYLTLGGHIH